MNVKILACTAIATSLLFTACVKKEEPKETEKQQTPKSSVVNQIPKDQQVQLSTDNNANNTATNNVTDVNANNANNSNNAVDLQASPGPSDTPAAPVKRPVEKPRPTAQAEPRKPAPQPQTPRAEAKAEKKPATENANTTDVKDDTVAGKTERVQAPAKSETPRATPAPITEKADQAQSVDDAIKQAMDAATPVK